MQKEMLAKYKLPARLISNAINLGSWAALAIVLGVFVRERREREGKRVISEQRVGNTTMGKAGLGFSLHILLCKQP